MPVLLPWQCRLVRAERAARWTNCPTVQLATCALTLAFATQEANYGYQQELDMIPLMMQQDYSAKGWLGLILGTRLWYATNCAVFPLLSFSSFFSD